MNGWNRQVERALLDAALGFEDDASRRRFLDAACSGNPELKTKLLELLADHACAESFFDFAAPGVALPEPQTKTTSIAQSVPDGIGVERYRIVRRLGEGGSGVVYLAEQNEPVQRVVALKILRRGMNSARAFARFELECNALARMNHPNIARVFDAGSTDDGRPFFAMELVTGERITRYCDAANVSFDGRIRLFLQVCHAVQHAHEKGILHRDLKPSNVLVTVQDGLAVPKIIDFGIAKVISEPDAGDSGSLAEPFMGTPAYMSPEQASVEREVDTRSDVYSLGALLYELLLGRPLFEPHKFDLTNLAGIRRVLRDEMPVRPSIFYRELDETAQKKLARSLRTTPAALIATLRRDVDWIVFKALAKDRLQRFPTVQSFATDLQSYLNHEPVSARPSTAMYRIGKYMRRHRVGFAATSAVVFALVAGLGTSTWLYFREREALRVQRQLRQEAEDSATITRAVYSAREGDLKLANTLLAGVARPADRPSFEGVMVYRLVGDWLALQKRWRETADRLSVVQRFGTLDEWNQVTRDHQSCGVALIAAGDMAGYERFREEHARRFSEVANGDAVGRVLKICLLRPPVGETASLYPALAERVETWFASLPIEYARDWVTIPVALWRYRRDDFEGAAKVARRGFDEHDHASSCTATQRVLLALCALRTGEVAEGRQALAIARSDIERVFALDLPTGDDRDGYWYDWLFAKIILDEASEVEGRI